MAFQHFVNFLTLLTLSITIRCGLGLNCYFGTDEGISSSEAFPSGMYWCEAKSHCVEVKGFVPNNSAFVYAASCDENCSDSSQNARASCRECTTDFCNDHYGRGLEKILPDYMCLFLLNNNATEAFKCANGEICASATNHTEGVDSKQAYYYQGCSKNCLERYGNSCKLCDTHLCNSMYIPGYGNSTVEMTSRPMLADYEYEDEFYPNTQYDMASDETSGSAGWSSMTLDWFSGAVVLTALRLLFHRGDI